MPEKLVIELTEAAESVFQLDKKMEKIHKEANQHKESIDIIDESEKLLTNNERLTIPHKAVN